MPAEGCPVVAGGGYVLALVEDLAFFEAQQEGEGIHDCGLAGLRGADYGDALAALDLEQHVPDRLVGPRGALEVGVAEVPQLDDRGHGPDASAREPPRAEIAARRSDSFRMSPSSGTPRARSRCARLAPKGTSSPISRSSSTRRKTSAGAPSMTLLPSSMTTTRSKRAASYIEWVTCRTPMPSRRLSSRTVATSRVATGTGRNEGGSSQKR